MLSGWNPLASSKDASLGYLFYELTLAVIFGQVKIL